MILMGHCMKCKDKRKMNVTKIDKTSKGTLMAKGTCDACSCGMAKILSKDTAQQLSTENNIALPE